MKLVFFPCSIHRKFQDDKTNMAALIKDYVKTIKSSEIRNVNVKVK